MSVIVRYRRIIIFIISIILVFWLLYVFRNVLLPFIIGMVLVFLFLPIVRWFEKKLPPYKNRWSGFKRIISIILLFIVLIGLLYLIGFFIVTALVESFSSIFSNFQSYIDNISNLFSNITSFLQQHVPAQYQDRINTALSDLASGIINAVQGAFLSSFSLISGTFSLVIGFATLPIFLFFMLKDSEKLNQGFYSAFSPWAAERIRGVITIIENVLGGYIRAYIILGAIVGILVFIGLVILGMPFAPALAVWAAITEVIPVLGPWIGGAAGVIVALAIDPQKVVWVVVMYFIVQNIEGNLLVPRIQGGYLKIHPVVILVLLPLGAAIAGLWGIILIVPLTATILQIYRYLRTATSNEKIEKPPGIIT